MWVQGNDVYLGARDALQAFKVSLHESGTWRIAFVKELEREDQGSDRVIVKWKSPGEFAPGWIPSIGILISSVKPAKPFSPARINDPRIRWFRAPARNDKFIFKVLFSKPNLSERDFQRVTIAGDRLVTRMVKTDGEIVWLVVREEPLTPAELEKIKDVMKKTKIHMRPGSSENLLNNSRGLLVVSEDNPGISTQPTIIDVPFGRENLEISTI